MTLGRRVWVGLADELPADADAAIVGRETWIRWRRRQEPVLERTLVASARLDPFGLLILLRPKEAIEQAALLREKQFTAEEIPEFHRSLVDISNSTDTDARDQLLRRILGSASIRLRQLQGDRLRAVALRSGGWTYGTRPAGLVVMNSTDSPRGQEIELTVLAPVGSYPIEVSVDDGGQVETIVFERRGTRLVALRPVPPRSSRLVTVWSDKAWVHGSDDTRELGVRIQAPVGR